MINFTYNPNEYEAKDFAPIPTGDYRVGIEDIQEKTFKSGNQGFEIMFTVSGKNQKLWYYLVLSNDNQQLTNQKLGQFFDSFGITDYDLNKWKNWYGKVGACRVKHEMYNGEPQAKVHYFLSKKQQEKLPPWENATQSTTQSESFQQVDADVPW